MDINVYTYFISSCILGFRSFSHSFIIVMLYCQSTCTVSLGVAVGEIHFSNLLYTALQIKLLAFEMELTLLHGSLLTRLTEHFYIIMCSQSRHGCFEPSIIATVHHTRFAKLPQALALTGSPPFILPSYFPQDFVPKPRTNAHGPSRELKRTSLILISDNPLVTTSALTAGQCQLREGISYQSSRPERQFF